MGKSPIPRQGAKVGASISRANLASRPLTLLDSRKTRFIICYWSFLDICKHKGVPCDGKI